MTELICNDTDIDRARYLRDTFIKKYRDLMPPFPSTVLAKLTKNPNIDGSFLKGPTYTTIDGVTQHQGVSEYALKALETLNGPHGWAVYKMLLIRSQSDDI